MNALQVVLVAAMLVSGLLAACAPVPPPQTAPVPEAATMPAVPSASAPSSNQGVDLDPQNATYLVERQPVTLVNGIAKQDVAPGSASKKITKYFGNAVDIDLNMDGLMDSAFLLTQESGGSGTFFYVAAAVKQQGGFLGTNAIFLGDRIAPQSTNVDSNNPAQFVVNYADRKAGEPMAAQPTVGVSRTFKLEDGTLVEVGTPPTQAP